ncbi:MAG: 30S ribosome-binding factor RbfA [Spirochaetaceae bacterium]
MERTDRAGRLLQRIISEMILTERVRDPRVSKLVTIHEVEVTKDLRNATVHVGGYVSEPELQSSVDGLNAAAGFLQAGIARHIQWKSTPKLTFVMDTRVRESQELLQDMDRHGL